MKARHVLLIASYPDSVVGFRGDLIQACIARGDQVTVAVPDLTAQIKTEIQQLGATTVDIPLQRTGMNPIADLRLLIYLFRLCRRLRPDVVMTYTIKPCIYGQIAARWAAVPTRLALITGLGYAFTGKKRGLSTLLPWVLRQLYRLGLNGAHRVVFQNQDDCLLFTQLGLAKRQNSSVVNGSGINLTRYTPQALQEQPNLQLLFIGRILKDKGIIELANAMHLLKQKGVAVDCHVVGWFDQNPTAIQPEQMAQWTEQDLLIFHGKQADVRPFIAQCDVFVLPSYREGTPRTVLESMAMQRAIITTDAPGCRQTVEDGVNGLLVPVGDSEALVNAIQSFIDDPLLIEKMGKASLARAQALYDVNVINQQMLAMMEKP